MTKEEGEEKGHGHALSHFGNPTSPRTNRRPSHDFPRRRALPPLPLLRPLSTIFKLTPISMPPPRRPPFLARHNEHPPSTPSAQRLRVSNSPGSSCDRSKADRAWQVPACRAADAVREVHVVPVGAVFEGQPGGAEGAPACTSRAVATDVAWGVKVAVEAGELVAWVERVAWEEILGWGSIGEVGVMGLIGVGVGVVVVVGHRGG